MIKNITRITIALDNDTNNLLEKLKKDLGLSQSELLRQALRFYSENEKLTDSSLRNKIYFYMDMLLSSEHVILDIDHWLLFITLVESSPEKESFWEKHREIARSHVGQLKQKIHSVRDILERLEACNFFIIVKNSEKDFTLILYSDSTKNFIKIFLEEFFSEMGFRAEIRESLTKLRVIIKD
jgi:hypothetical protein